MNDTAEAPEPQRVLAPHHLQMLEASAIAPEVVAARGYWTATRKVDLARLGFASAQQLTPGLVIPIATVHGDLGTYMLRPDVPRIRAGKPAKYEFIKGSHMVLDVPIFETNRQGLKNPTLPLWVTEGAKKADALVSQGCCAVSVPGVWNWRGTNNHGGKTALADWELIALNDRTIYLVFDSDILEKMPVYQALERLGAFLTSRHARVRYVYLPSAKGAVKVGVDDFLAQGHTIDDVLGLVTTTLKRPPQAAETDWQQALQLNERGDPRQNMFNIGWILDHHPHWQQEENTFWLDEVRGESRRGADVMSEETITEVGEWLGQQTGMNTTNDKLIKRAISLRCTRRRRDLLQEELDALPSWDGVERLDYWLADYAGVVRTAYGMAVSRLLPVSLIVRAYHPGCQYRYVVVLVGDEDTGKTKLLRHLVGDAWFAEISSSLEGKEAHMVLRGLWLVEFGELESLNKTTENRLKSYITTEADRYIPKFENYPIKVMRRAVLTGTTNEQEFLKGQTGNTRYLPVQCGEMDPDGLVHIRAQLFAEAIVYWQAHPHDWWRLEDEAMALAVLAREARREKSVYEDRLTSLVGEYADATTQPGGDVLYTTWVDRILDTFGIPLAHQTPAVVRQVVLGLRAGQWTASPEKERMPYQGKTVRVRVWRRPKTGDDP